MSRSSLLSLEEFRDAARGGDRLQGRGVRSESGSVLGAAGSRTLRWVLSDGSIDRMGDTVDPNGWELDAFKRNPVVLWAHDASEPPIGRAKNVRSTGYQLVADIEFAAREVSEFADDIFRLVKDGFIKAGSVGFQPIDWTFSKDADRIGGIDFHRQELLEFSIVPVPALPSALVTNAMVRRMAAETGSGNVLDRDGPDGVAARKHITALRRAIAEEEDLLEQLEHAENLRRQYRGI